jgi:hypothetical protein
MSTCCCSEPEYFKTKPVNNAAKSRLGASDLFNTALRFFLGTIFLVQGLLDFLRSCKSGDTSERVVAEVAALLEQTLREY